METDSLLFANVKAAFDERNWMFREVSGREVVEAEFEAHHGRVRLHVEVIRHLNVVSVVARPLGSLSTDTFPKACELLMRTNLELTVGNFELDWDRGVVHFRASNIFPGPGSRDCREVVGSLVRMGIAETDRISAFVNAVEQAESSEKAAIDVTELMSRADLLPPVEENDAPAGP